MNIKTSIGLAGGDARRRSESDYYPTPPEATQALLDFLKLPADTVIWEPACGQGHMVNVMVDNGYCVIDTDIITGIDFLMSECRKCDWIITNPPFSISQEFIERSITHHKPFAFLLKSQYWHAKKRYDLFDRYKPKYILPLTWRPDFLFGARGGASLMDVMWVVWGETGADQTTYAPLKRPVLHKMIL